MDTLAGSSPWAGKARWLPLTFALALGLVAGCDSGSESPGERTRAPAVAVAVQALDTQTMTLRRRWSGTLEPLRAVSVQALEGGRVDALEVRDGQWVTRGDVLVRLSGPEIQARRDGLMQRQRHLEDQLSRWQRLAETQAAGAADLTEAVLRLLEVQEALTVAEAALESYLVRAPVSGQVRGTTVDIGGFVPAGAALLWVEDSDSRGVRLSLSARETVYLERDANLTLRDDRGNTLEFDRIVFLDDARPGFVIAEIQLRGDTQSRREVEVIYEASEEVLIVPWTAIASDDGDTWVARVSGDPPRIERRAIDLGRAHPAGVELLRGLAVGDLVVRFEPRSYAEGLEVRPLRDPQ